MIEAINISKSFGENLVLKNVSVDFEKGKTNLIIGQSGSGKTVLMKCLVGLHEVDEGRVMFDDRNFSGMNFIERKSVRKEIGMLFQGGALFDSMTVEENVMFPLTMYTNQSMDEKRERVNFCLEWVNLENANQLFPAELSGGMVKRVAIARAIVNKPPILLADEPTGNLDSTTADEIMNLLKELNAEGQTIIMVTHNPEACKHTARTIQVKDGSCYVN